MARSLTVLCKTIEASPHNCGLEFDTGKKLWQKAEPGFASEVFATVRGRYAVIGAFPDALTVLSKVDGTNVGELRGFDPEKTAEGAKGKGLSGETGRAFDWTADKATET